MATQGLLRRIAELEAEVRRLGELAHTDGLTGLPNRRALEVALERELARSARAGQPLCLAALDLDHFKGVNDAHGHPGGDQLLREAAVAWRAELRADDLLARNYGDEFTAVLPNCRLEEAAEVIERLRAATPAGQTCSVGLVRWDGRESTEAIGARADRALYAAKQAGRNLTIAAGYGSLR
jgi:diguanylate cyclase (GGDEF)-like protein